MTAATNSLDRALALLKLIEHTRGGLRNVDISRQLKIPKSTCSYITSRLEREGYVARDESGRYRIGLATVALAYGALRDLGIRSVAEPALYKLTGQTGLSAGIGILERGSVLLVDRVEGSGFVNRAVEAAGGSNKSRPYRIRAQRDVGRQLPVHSTALGKVLLAFLPERAAAEVIAIRGMGRSTHLTNVSSAKLMSELAEVRKQGYALADGEAYLDLRALAAPIFDASGDARAAVSVNGSPRDPVWNDVPELVKLVQLAARDISRRARFLPATR